MSSADDALKDQLARLRQAGAGATTPASGAAPAKSWDSLLAKALAPLASDSPRPGPHPSAEGADTRIVATTPAPAALVILRPDSIGDLILFEPLLRILREAWSETRIHVVGTRTLDAVSRMMPERVAWHVVDDAPPFQTPTAAAVEALRKTLAEIDGAAWLFSACPRKTWWDVVAPGLRSFERIVSLGPVPVAESLRRALIRAGVEGSLPGYPETVSNPTASHEWHLVLESAAYLIGGPVPQLRPRLRLSEEVRQAVDRTLPQLALKEGRFIACCPVGTANVSLKAWPAARFAQVLTTLQREHGHDILLVGTQSEEPVLGDVAKRIALAGGTARVWTGHSAADFETLCGLLSRSSLYLGNDTGPMHAAAALGRPVVGVFGGGTWPRFTPCAEAGAAVVRVMPCFGCDWQCHLGDAPCLRLVEPETVLGAARAALAGARFEIVNETAHAAPEIDEIARGASQQARILAGRAEHLRGVCEEQNRYISETEAAKREVDGYLAATRQKLEELSRVCEDQNRYIEEMKAAKREVDGYLAVTKEEASQRLATILEQNTFISDLEALTARLDAEKTALAARLEETRAALAAKQALAAHLARQYEAAARKAAADHA